jgi:hypothetical protein
VEIKTKGIEIMKNELTTKDELNTLYENMITNESQDNIKIEYYRVVYDVKNPMSTNLKLAISKTFGDLSKAKKFADENDGIIQNMEATNYLRFTTDAYSDIERSDFIELPDREYFSLHNNNEKKYVPRKYEEHLDKIKNILLKNKITYNVGW